MRTKLTKAQCDFMASMAKAIIRDEERKPRRVYIGQGIWWTPSARYWITPAGRAALAATEAKP